MSHPSLNPRRRPCQIRATAIRSDWRHDGQVRLMFDRLWTDVPQSEEAAWSVLAEIEGSGGALIEWRSISLCESDRPGDGLVLEAEQAQRLMDKLWDCGLRPTEGSGSAGSLAAMQRHLEDMRTLLLERPNPLVAPLQAMERLAERLAERSVAAEGHHTALCEELAKDGQALRDSIRRRLDEK